MAPAAVFGKSYGRRLEYSTYYRLNGVIYLQKKELLMKKGNLYGEKSYAYVMNRENSVDIDDALAFMVAEAVTKSREL